MTSPPLDGRTAAQEAECLALAEAMERVKALPGGLAFVTDLFMAIIAEQGLKVVDAAAADAGVLQRRIARAIPLIDSTPRVLLRASVAERLERALTILRGDADA